MNTVNKIWTSSNLDQMIINVFGRLKVVFCNILKDGGGNYLVEETRGVKNRNVKVKLIIREMQGNLDDKVDLQDINLELNVKEDNDEIPIK